MNQSVDLSELVFSMDADFFGVADLTRPDVQAFLLDQGGEIINFPRAISIGIALPNAIVDLLPRRAEKAIAVSYKLHAYEYVNRRLDDLAGRLASRLQQSGFRAFPVPAASILDRGRLIGLFSHKLAAHCAGLGWIGRSCLLVTPQAGPRVRWTTVLTGAPLSPTGSPMEPGCGDCHACVDICPVGAFTDRMFDPAEPRALRYDAHKCERYIKEMEAVDPTSAVCGMCLYACPYGQLPTSANPATPAR